MAERENIRVELVKLASGERLLRLEHPRLRFAVEKTLDSKESVAAQKARLVSAFEAAAVYAR